MTRCVRRPPCSAPRTSTARPGSPTHGARSTWPSCTSPSRGTSPSGWSAFGLAEEGEGWNLVDDGTTELGGSLPINASGGVLSSNPIGASGLLRFAEAANQVRGAAGEHQVEGAKVAIGMAYGANSQYFSTWAVGGSLQPFG